MVIGIVGAEGAKFTEKGEWAARVEIVNAIIGADKVVSGACHLGGVDTWAIEEAGYLGIETEEFPPSFLTWQSYKRRNIEIAEVSDYVLCITVDVLPPDFKGMTHKLCYHCGTDEHVKSGGCWTVKYALTIGKQGHVIRVKNV